MKISEYKFFHEGECIPQAPVCPTACPFNYEPICGTGQSGDVKTFANKCVFESDNCLNENNRELILLLSIEVGDFN